MFVTEDPRKGKAGSSGLRRYRQTYVQAAEQHLGKSIPPRPLEFAPLLNFLRSSNDPRSSRCRDTQSFRQP